MDEQMNDDFENSSSEKKNSPEAELEDEDR